MGRRCWRTGLAEVLCHEPSHRVAHNPRHILMVATRLNSANDNVEPQILIWASVLIYAHFKIRRRVVIGEIDCAPLNVEDTVRRAARG